jgi:putative flavoprotein involved in K+ transport
VSTDCITQQVKDWVQDFAVAAADGNARRISELFAPDGHWRDLLAFSWEPTSFPADAIASTLHRALAEVSVRDVAARPGSPPRLVSRADREVIEAVLRMRTSRGECDAVLRLHSSGPHAGKAWVLMTALHGFTGHQPRAGVDRPRRTPAGGEPPSTEDREADAPSSEPSVLIVGGGPAGLGLAARLAALDVAALVIERRARIGDSWRARYRTLSLHNPIWVNHLPYLAFPETWPTYLPKDMFAWWLENYADAMNLDYWVDSELERATRDTHSDRWRATVRCGPTWRTVSPRHIVVATGLSTTPRRPELDGLDRFGGSVLHADDYRDGARYAGCRALVIGTGTSGHDIAQELHGYGAEVHMMQRGPTTVVQVEPTAHRAYSLYGEGLPIEVADLISLAAPYPVLLESARTLTEAVRDDDAELIDRLQRAGMQVDYGADGTGFQLKYLRTGGGFYFNVGCSDLISAGEIRIVPAADLGSFEKDGLQLRSGDFLPLDLIVLATGYTGPEELVRSCFGADVADTVGPIWGLDARGEVRNMWRPTAQEGLWFHGGNLAQSRIYSHYLALQIQARELGLSSLRPPVAVG